MVTDDENRVDVTEARAIAPSLAPEDDDIDHAWGAQNVSQTLNEAERLLRAPQPLSQDKVFTSR